MDAGEVSLLFLNEDAVSLRASTTRAVTTQVNGWFKDNDLFLNINETKFINFNIVTKLHTACDIVVNTRQTLHNDTAAVFLALTVDEAVCWIPHIENLMSH